MITSRHEDAQHVGATGVRFAAGDMMYVSLDDGREIGLPLKRIGWLDWLARATSEQRDRWSIEPRGFAIYWEDLDDGLEVDHLLALGPLE